MYAAAVVYNTHQVARGYHFALVYPLNFVRWQDDPITLDFPGQEFGDFIEKEADCPFYWPLNVEDNPLLVPRVPRDCDPRRNTYHPGWPRAKVSHYA